MLTRAYISKNPYLSDEIDAATDRDPFRASSLIDEFRHRRKV